MSVGADVTQQLVRLAWPTDVSRLQHLLERCSDYYELHEGWSTPPDGIGSLLLRHASEAVAADGATAIPLAVSIHNPRAESFWTAAGFRPEGQPRAAPARSGHVDTVRIMSRVLYPSGYEARIRSFPESEDE